MSDFNPGGLGWHRDLPDPRDRTPRHEEVVRLLDGLSPRGPLSASVDLREYCSEVGDQQQLGASTAHACLGLVSYFERRALGRLIEPSRLFVYKTARRLLGMSGDSGADLRSTWKAIVRFGAPPERFWPYDADRIDEEPDGFVYTFSREFQSLCYVRLDGTGQPGDATLQIVKSYLAGGLPSVFGFSVCTSISDEAEIPFPTAYDAVRGGQAVVAVGYDDERRNRSDRGALLIRNSWGTNWGDRGYGWLPYAYVRENLAADFWTVLKADWLTSGEFDRPT